MELSPEEIRVLGCLIEKQMTTPDYYPMTQNALVNACNQATSRDPVVEYGDGAVIQALNDLRDHGLARAVHAPGQRAVKYRHVLDEALEVRPPELALLAVLMLRGEQTAGELRTRTARYRSFASPAEVVAVLDGLAGREQPLVARLGRRPGEKETRWRHLLSGATAPPPDPSAPEPLGPAVEPDRPSAEPDRLSAEPDRPAPPAASPEDGLAVLRAEVAELRSRVEALEERLGQA